MADNKPRPIATPAEYAFAMSRLLKHLRSTDEGLQHPDYLAALGIHRWVGILNEAIESRDQRLFQIDAGNREGLPTTKRAEQIRKMKRRCVIFRAREGKDGQLDDWIGLCFGLPNVHPVCSWTLYGCLLQLVRSIDEHIRADGLLGCPNHKGQVERMKRVGFDAYDPYGGAPIPAWLVQAAEYANETNRTATNRLEICNLDLRGEYTRYYTFDYNIEPHLDREFRSIAALNSRADNYGGFQSGRLTDRQAVTKGKIDFDDTDRNNRADVT